MEQLKAFMEKAQSDSELVAKLEALGIKGAGVDDYIALAAEYGFSITAEELEEASKHVELSEEELDNVAGGTGRSTNCWFTPTGRTGGENGEKWLECGSFCGITVGLGNYCRCWHRDECINKWHKAEPDGYLFPKTYWNHSTKIPPTYES